MRKISLALFGLILHVGVEAQFYPSANAVWCGIDDDGGPPGFEVQFQMSVLPDTLINDFVYKMITEYNNHTGDWLRKRDYYVRSDGNGKGYIYLPDSMAEFLAGDVSVQPGDTVYDILIADSGPDWVNYSLHDLVVDSVLVLTNAGVTVTRYYVDPESFGSLGADVVFWQSGMGTASGPLLEDSGPFHRAWVNDTVVYNIENSGLPGPGNVGQICWSIPMSVAENEQQSEDHLLLFPNPSNGNLVQLTVDFPDGEKAVILWDASGRRVSSTSMMGTTMDLNVPTCSGVYLVKVIAHDASLIGRIVVQ